MATTYYWKPTNLFRTNTDGIVYEIQYQVAAERDGVFVNTHENKTLSAGDPSSPDFIAYEDLTKDQIISWLKSDDNEAAIEERLTSLLDAIAEQDNVGGGLPWVLPDNEE